MRLTDLSLRALTIPESGQRDYPDDAVAGLAIRVGKTTKTFTLVIGTGTKRQRITLGRYPDLTVSKARERARDVLAQHRVAKSDTPSVRFTDALDTYYRLQNPRRRNSTNAQCARLLDKYFLPPLAARKLEAIRPSDLAPLIDGIESHAIRRNAYVFLRAFFNWCYRRGYIELSPVARLEAPEASTPRDRVLTPDELRCIWHACPPTDYGAIVRLCMISGQRIGQWMHLRTEYIHGDLITWPPEAMKSGRSHTIPLTPMIAAILTDRVLPSWVMDGRTKIRLDRASGVTGWRHHDLRRTWATLCADELNIEPHIIESVLAHAMGTPIARTYNRAKYIEPMRKALLAFEEWLQAQLSKPEDANGRDISGFRSQGSRAAPCRARSNLQPATRAGRQARSHQ